MWRIVSQGRAAGSMVGRPRLWPAIEFRFAFPGQRAARCRRISARLPPRWVRSCRVARTGDRVLEASASSVARSGQLPAELVFDSRLTTYANLARLDAMGIGFLTLRRRSARLVDALLAEPPEKWRRVTLTNVARRFRTPRILEQTVRLGDCPDPVRQIAVRDLGHDRPTLLITNQLDASPRELIDRYARRMVIENTIADAIDFFHMDALSAVVPMKVDVDVQLTVMASSLYRILARRIGNRCENQKPAQLFRKFVNAAATVDITESEIVVSYGRRRLQPVPGRRRTVRDRRKAPVARRSDVAPPRHLSKYHAGKFSWETRLGNPAHEVEIGEHQELPCGGRSAAATGSATGGSPR